MDEDDSLANFDDNLDLSRLLGTYSDPTAPLTRNGGTGVGSGIELNSDVSELLGDFRYQDYHHPESGGGQVAAGSLDPGDELKNDPDLIRALAESLQEQLMEARAASTRENHQMHLFQQQQQQYQQQEQPQPQHMQLYHPHAELSHVAPSPSTSTSISTSNHSYVMSYTPAPAVPTAGPSRRGPKCLATLSEDSLNMPGRYQFKLDFKDLKDTRKCFEYDNVGRKLYVHPFKPIRMACEVVDDGTWNSERLFMRIIPKFQADGEAFKPVARCQQHSNVDDPSNLGFDAETSRHFVRLTPSRTAESAGGHGSAGHPDHPNRRSNQLEVRYESDYVAGDGRLSVRMDMPGSSETPGADKIVVNFGVKFMCYHACRVSGLNRQRIYVFFMLENADGECLGREMIEVRPCASPARDYKTDLTKRASALSGGGSGKKKALKRPHYLVTSSDYTDSEAGCSSSQPSTSGGVVPGRAPPPGTERLMRGSRYVCDHMKYAVRKPRHYPGP